MKLSLNRLFTTKNPKKKTLEPKVVNGQKQSGFSLIEVMISIIVMGIILGGAMKLIESSITMHHKNSKRIMAIYLVQECLEITRNNRDSNWMKSLPWDQDLAAGIETQVNNFYNRSVIISEPLESETIITESGEIIQPLSVQIDCTVDWEDAESVSISQILTNWRK